ncbi:MAG: histidine kinase [Bacteroidota bacterium]|nr:histidine kinase [Bacteroidota bacterium]
MQSGYRGFLLTGQIAFLQPYYEGLRTVPPLMKEQRKLLSTPQQKYILDSINLLHSQWVEYSNSLIKSRLDTLAGSKKYIELFNAKFRKQVGKHLNDRIHQAFLALDNSEYKIRREKRAALQNALYKTRVLTLSLTITSIIVALLSSFYFIQVITSRISKMVRQAQTISNGQFVVIEDKKKDELNQLAISLNTMSETLQKNFNDLTKKNTELDQFAYVVSHDLKAPMRGIANIISWIEEDHSHELSTDLYKNLMLIKGRTIRLENMINGLLEYARVDKVRRGAEITNINQLLKEIIDLHVPPGYGINIIGEMPVFKTEKIHIQQVFSNLISNAVKYNNNQQPKIVITCEEKKEHYIFSVSDNGPGIEEQYFDKIFVIFQTLQERDAFESTGVGLAIVKKIIDDYKGTISIKSEPDHGSTFSFTWPKSIA